MTFKTLFAATALSTMMMSANAFAEVAVSQPWARASAGQAQAGAAFMTLTNTGTSDDTLVGAKADVSARVELHTHTMVDGVMQMRQVEGGIPVPAGATQMLQPGGYHVMFLGLKAPLKEGATFPLTLTFKSGQSATIDVQVMAPTAMGQQMQHGQGMGGGMGGQPMQHHGQDAMPAHGHDAMHQH